MTGFCLFRFNGRKMEILERFPTFLDLEQLTGEHNEPKIIEFHEQSGQNSKQCRARCYDGASNI